MKKLANGTVVSCCAECPCIFADMLRDLPHIKVKYPDIWYYCGHPNGHTLPMGPPAIFKWIHPNCNLEEEE